MSAVEDLLEIIGSSSSDKEGSSPIVETKGDEIEIDIGGGRLQQIRKQMERERIANEKMQKEIIEGGPIISDKLGANKIRINNTIVLEANQNIIATALDIKKTEGDMATDPFWLLDNITPFRVVEKMDPRGRPRTDRELERVISRIKGDIKKMERGQLKRGRNLIRKKKFGDFTLLYWPEKPRSIQPGAEIEEVILRPPISATKKFITFQNFDIPAPSLSSKINPWSSLKKTKMMDVKELLREKGVKVDFDLDGEIDDKIRNISKDRLYQILVEAKGLDKEEIFEESEVRNIGGNKYDFVRQKVRELNERGELEIEKDVVGEKILTDFLLESDPRVNAAMATYHFRRLNPKIFTKDTLLDYYGRVMSDGLVDYLAKGKNRGYVEDVLYKQLLSVPLDENYKYLFNVGFVPQFVDEFGRQRTLIELDGFETDLFQFIQNFFENFTFTERELREFFVGPEKERITQEQWDVINSEWEIYKVQFDDPSDYDSAKSTDELEPQTAFDLASSRATLLNEVDALEDAIYAESEDLREYIIKISTIAGILDLDIANNIKNRINSGAVSVENMYLLSAEEMLPELFLSEKLKGKASEFIEMEGSEMREILEIRGIGSRFKKWLDNKIFSEANMLMAVYLPMIKKDWFPSYSMPFTFEAKEFAVPEKELCGTLNSNKYYVMTADGIKCMTSSQIKKNIKELKNYNRKDLEAMIDQ